MQVLLHGGDLGGDTREWPEGEPSRAVFGSFVYELRPDVVGQVTTEAGAEDLRSAVLCAVVSGDTLGRRIESAIAVIKTLTTATLANGFKFRGLRFDATPRARAEWNMISTNADTIPKPYYVVDQSGSSGVFLNTVDDMRAFYNACMNHVAACQGISNKAESSARSAEDEDDIESVLAKFTLSLDALGG